MRLRMKSIIFLNKVIIMSTKKTPTKKSGKPIGQQIRERKKDDE